MPTKKGAEFIAAAMARGTEAARRLLDELKQRAPEGLRPLYDVIASRATDNHGTPARDHNA